MGYWLYILHTESANRYYIGQSENPERRLEFHNTIEKGFTSRYRPWKLVFKREFETRQESVRVEKLIKGWKSSKKISKLISGEISI